MDDSHAMVRVIALRATVGLVAAGGALLLGACDGDMPLGELEPTEGLAAPSSEQADSEPEVAGATAGDAKASMRPLLACDDRTDPDREVYDLEVLNAELTESPEVQTETGIQTVTTCLEARKVREAQDRLAASAPPIEDEPAPPAAEEEDAEEDTEQRIAKIYDGEQAWLDA